MWVMCCWLRWVLCILVGMGSIILRCIFGMWCIFISGVVLSCWRRVWCGIKRFCWLEKWRWWCRDFVVCGGWKWWVLMGVWGLVGLICLLFGISLIWFICVSWFIGWIWCLKCWRSIERLFLSWWIFWCCLFFMMRRVGVMCLGCWLRMWVKKVELILCRIWFLS